MFGQTSKAGWSSWGGTASLLCKLPRRGARCGAEPQPQMYFGSKSAENASGGKNILKFVMNQTQLASKEKKFYFRSEPNQTPLDKLMEVGVNKINKLQNKQR